LKIVLILRLFVMLAVPAFIDVAKPIQS